MNLILLVVALLFLWVLWRYFSRSDAPPVKQDQVAENAMRKRGAEAEAMVEAVLKQSSIPFIHTLYIQHLKRGFSNELDFVAVVGQELWIIEVKGWSGELRGQRDVEGWVSEKVSQGGNHFIKERRNPFFQLVQHEKQISRIAKSSKAKGVRIKKVLVMTHGTPRVDDLKTHESAFTLAQFKRAIKTAQVSKIEGGLKQLWQRLNKIHQSVDPVTAERAHRALVAKYQSK